MGLPEYKIKIDNSVLHGFSHSSWYDHLSNLCADAKNLCIIPSKQLGIDKRIDTKLTMALIFI